MRQTWGGALRWVCGAAFLLAILGATSAGAQRPRNDDAARKHFELGRAAFEQEDYQTALLEFRYAYGMSSRPELLYNMGVALERLQREQDALQVFEQYLAKVEDPQDEAEVRERIAALRLLIAEKQADSGAPMKPGTRDGVLSDEQDALQANDQAGRVFQTAAQSEPVDEPRAKKKWPWLVAAAAAIAAAGVTTGLLVSQRSGQGQSPAGLKVEW